MSENKTDISVLFEGLDVSAEQQEKFQINLEAIISEAVTTYKSEVDAENEKVIAEQVEAQTADVTNKVDDYLSYVVETWAEENQLAIENGIKLEIMESFIEGMKSLFAEHYVDVPEGKDDMVSAAESKVAELQDDLNEEIQKNIAARKELEQIKKDGIVAEATDDLTDTQKEKFGSLIEDIEFNGVEGYTKKVQTIRESFFNTGAGTTADDDKTDDKKAAATKTDRMSAYAAAL